jgi:hypothetical protein
MTITTRWYDMDKTIACCDFDGALKRFNRYPF